MNTDEYHTDYITAHFSCSGRILADDDDDNDYEVVLFAVDDG